MSEAPVAIGQVLAGKYRVDRVLGHGGMGVVVAATHLQLDERVALKFLLPDAMRSTEVVERFAREARAASKIKSEHVARVIDVGTLEGGAPYMVMEYLDGCDLAAELHQKRQLAVEDVASYILQALEALAEAHAIGIVHRDLKPGNLFLTRRKDKSAMVKVLDFGISKAPVGTDNAMTKTANVMGSPLYMSPEQLMSAKHVDARSDIWSMGVVIYELLGGGPPFIAETMPEVVAQILGAPLPPIRSKRPDVPEELAAIIARCLAKDPNARFSNVAELARALAPFASDGRRSYERIARVLEVSHSDRPPPPTSAQPRVSVPGAPVATLAMSDAGQSGWGHTQAAVKKRPIWPVALGAGVIVLAIGAVGIWKLTRHEAATTTETAKVETPPSTTTALIAPPTETTPPQALAQQAASLTPLLDTAPPSATTAKAATHAAPKPSAHNAAPPATSAPAAATTTAAATPKDPMKVILK